MLARLGTLIADWIDRNSITEVVLNEDEIKVISMAWGSMPAKYLTSDDVNLLNAYQKVLEANQYRHLFGRAECYPTYQERKSLRDLIDGYCEWMAEKLPHLPECYEAEYIGWYNVASRLIQKLR